MKQTCFASWSDTGLSCAWSITRDIIEDGVELSQYFCEKHNKPCKELGYYCSSFIGYHPDYRMSDEEEQDLVEKLRKGE